MNVFRSRASRVVIGLSVALGAAAASGVGCSVSTTVPTLPNEDGGPGSDGGQKLTDSGGGVTDGSANDGAINLDSGLGGSIDSICGNAILSAAVLCGGTPPPMNGWIPGTPRQVPHTRRRLEFAGADGGADAGASCPSSAPTAADLDAQGGWNPPGAITKTACTSADLQALNTNFNNVNINAYNQLETGLSASCVSCVFTDDSAANWGVIVLDSTNEANGFINFGACYGAVVSPACGKAEEYDEFCFTDSCSACADADFQTCEQLTSVSTACSANFQAAITSSCGDTTKGIGGI